MFARPLILIIVGVLNLLVAVVILARDTKKLSNICYFLMSFLAGAWAIGIAQFMLTDSPNAALLWAKLFYAAPLLLVVAFVFFAYSFPNYQTIPRRVVWTVSIACASLLLPLLLLDNFLISGVTFQEWGKEVVLLQPDYFFYSLYVMWGFLWGLMVIHGKSRTERGLYKAQAKLFFMGYLPASFLGMLFNLILPGLGNYKLIWLGPLATNIYIVATAISIVRHRMFDIQLVIARSIAYLSSLIMLGAIYGFLVFGVAQFVFDLHFAVNVQIALSLATGIAGLSFYRLRKIFDRMTNSIFYRDAYDPQTLFNELNRTLVSTTDIDELLTNSSHVIASHLKASYCLFGLAETESSSQRIFGTLQKQYKQDEVERVRHLTVKIKSKIIVTDYLPQEQDELRVILAKKNISMLVRLTATPDDGKEGLGYIVLGPKRSGNPYTNQDIRMLDTIANEFIIAIQNVLHFEEIQKFNITLQKRVEDATAELRRSNAQLEALDETKNDFISMASHQLRTPLTSVKGYLSMVLEGDAGRLTDVQRRMLDQAYLSSQRMVFLIADLLNVSRLKTGKFVIERHPVNLAALIQEEIDQLREEIQVRSLKIAYKSPKNFPDLMLDENKTRQVVMNFLDNAAYYTPAGGRIKVELTQQATMIELRVTDTGIGVPKAEQHHLFTKFYRAGNAKRARPDGTGLGLFMAKKVVVAQGGEIIFQSKEGEGSTFGFTLPKMPVVKNLVKKS